MLGYDLLQHLSDSISQSDPDLVSDAVQIRSLRAISKLTDVSSLGHPQANFHSLPQLRWRCSQTGFVRR